MSNNVATTQNNGLEVLGMRITSLQEAMNLADIASEISFFNSSLLGG